jgi:hypothetical protein
MARQRRNIKASNEQLNKKTGKSTTGQGLSTQILSPKVQALVNVWLGAIAIPDKNPIQLYLDMVTTNPVASAANDLRVLLGLSMFGEYSHSDEKIQGEVRASINNMPGTWRNALAGMMTYLAFGRSFTEKAYKIVNKKAELDRLQTLDPRRYVFEGSLGEITRVHYYGMTDLYISYENGIHFINQPHLALGGDPYGIAICKRAYPFVELARIIMAQVTISSKRQANKLLVGKTDTSNDSVTLPDSTTGQPILDETTGEPRLFNQGYVLGKSLSEVENNSFLVVDINDQIEAISHETDGSFFINILSYLESMILLCWLVPRTITGTATNGTGDSNLNEGHREMLSLVNGSEMQYVGDTLTEELIRPMLEFNYGYLDDYGHFPLNKEDSADRVALLQVLTGAVERGSFSASDLAVINRMRQLADIEQIKASEFVPLELQIESVLPTPSGTGENLAAKKKALIQ